MVFYLYNFSCSIKSATTQPRKSVASFPINRLFCWICLLARFSAELVKSISIKKCNQYEMHILSIKFLNLDKLLYDWLQMSYIKKEFQVGIKEICKNFQQCLENSNPLLPGILIYNISQRFTTIFMAINLSPESKFRLSQWTCFDMIFNNLGLKRILFQ